MSSPVPQRTTAATPSDRELVEASRNGDLKAYEELVRRYQSRICRLATHLLKSKADAEDVAQETFVRAYRALASFDGRSEPFTWIYRIAVNLSLNVIRSRRTRKQATTDDDPRIDAQLVERRPGYADPSLDLSDREVFGCLSNALDSLSDTLRTTLLLVCVDGLSHLDAGKILGCPEGTVAWRVHEGRRKLREHMEANGVDFEENS